MIGLDFVDLVAIYEYGRVWQYGSGYTASEPTDSSLAMIKRVVGSDLPSDLVKFAKACPAYTNDFALIGEDVDAVGYSYEQHIINLYHAYAPEDYVPLTWPNDGRCIAFHEGEPEGWIYNLEGGNFAMLGVDYYIEGEEVPFRANRIAKSFYEYLERYVSTNAIGSRLSVLTTLKMCQRQPVNPKYLEGAERKLRELEERQEFVVSILKKYPGSASLIAEIEQGF